MKNIYLITGAAGFIGSHLLELLLEEGVPEKAIKVVLRGKDKLHIRGKFSIIRGDLEDEVVCNEAIKGVSIVYHLAATSGFQGSTLSDYRKGNVLTTKNLIRACAGKHVKKFVYFSSIAVYGIPSGIGDITGWNEKHPQTFTEIYGQSKSEAETIVVQQKYVPYTILRPSSVYGPRDMGQLYGLYQAINRGMYFHIGNGKNVADFIYVKDLVKASRLAELSTSSKSDYILASGNPVSMNYLVDCIAKSIHKPRNFVRVPKSIALPMSHITEMLGKILNKPSPLFPSRVKILTSSYWYDTSKARSELGFIPQTSIETGTKITGHWYQKHNYV